ncbi:MAG: transglutaminase domain-containing protein [Clostridia bacterium]|nr:transglutaminase domain-containing protein [Clostridia bacterium]
MIKRSKLVYILGSIIIGIVAVISVFAGLTLSGVIDAGSRVIVFVSESKTKVYDGEKLVHEEWSIAEGELKDGHEAKVVFTGNQTVVGQSQNEYTVTIVDANGADVSDDYEITIETGILGVTPRPIAMQSASATKEYDGEPLTCDEITIVEGSCAGTDIASYVLTGSRTDVGVDDNLFVPKIVDKNGNDVTHNYEITCLYGTLTVTPMPITLYTGSKLSKVYDGTPLRGDVSACSFVGEKTPLEGHEATITLSGEQTEVGESENLVASVVIVDTNDEDRDVTFNYDITYQTNVLVVEKRRITITGGDMQWTYDGAEHTYPHHEITSFYKVVSGQILDVVITGAITDVGTTANTVEDYIIYADDTRMVDVTPNYEVTVKDGTLRVTEAEGTDDPDDPDDGDGNFLGGEMDGKIGTGGTIPDKNTIVAQVYSDKSGTVYLRQYSKGEYQGNRWASATAYTDLLDGKYSMNYLTGIALENSSQAEKAEMKIYPKIPSAAGYMLPTYLDNSESLYDVQTNDVYNSGTKVEYYKMYYFPYDYAFDDTPVTMNNLGDYTANENNYRWFINRDNKQYKSLPNETKSAMDVIIAEQGWERSSTGDDRELIAEVAAYVRKVKGYDLRYDTALDEQPDIAVAFLTDPQFKTGICQHYATSATVLFRALGFPARYTCGYAVKTEAGQTVDVSAMQAHAWVEVYLTGIGWVTVEVTGGGGGPGVPSDGEPEIPGDDEGEPTNPDKIATIMLSPKTLKKLYDGTPLVPTENDVTCKVNKTQELADLIADGTIGSYEYVLEGSQTEVGISLWSADLKLFDVNGIDISDKFSIDNTKTGTLHVYKYTLTVTTGGAEKTYDGTPLTNDSYTVTGLQDGDVAEVVVTGKNSGLGIAKNTCAVNILRNGELVTDEYDVQRVLGDLQVNEIAMEVKAASVEKVYDGTPLTWEDANSWTIACDGKIDGHTVYVELTGELAGDMPGECPNHIVKVTVLDENEQDVTDYYTIKTTDGTLKITAP